MDWKTATENIGRKVSFQPGYPEGTTYEGRIIGLDHPRGQPGIPSVYIVTCRKEETPETIWETANRVAVDAVTFLDEPRVEHSLSSWPAMPIDTGHSHQDVEIKMLEEVGYRDHVQDPLLNYAQLQKEVGEWSQANFGNNPCNLLAIEYTGSNKDKPPIVLLGPFCSLLGIGEEIGEFFMTAEETGEGHLIERKATKEEQRDSLGDTVIYCCDYATRWGITLPPQYPPSLDALPLHPTIGLPGSLGALMHCNLKRLQSIRGFDDPEKFRKHSNRWLHSTMRYASAMSQWLLGEDLLVVANETWQNIVKKRDWKKNATVGFDPATDSFCTTPEVAE